MELDAPVSTISTLVSLCTHFPPLHFIFFLFSSFSFLSSFYTHLQPTHSFFSTRTYLLFIHCLSGCKYPFTHSKCTKLPFFLNQPIRFASRTAFKPICFSPNHQSIPLHLRDSKHQQTRHSTLQFKTSVICDPPQDSISKVTAICVPQQWLASSSPPACWQPLFLIVASWLRTKSS